MRSSYFTTVLLVTTRKARALSTETLTVLSQLKNPALLEGFLHTDDDVTESFAVRNPAQPDSILARLPRQGRQETRQAIEAAFEALPRWRDQTTAASRSQRLHQWHALIQDNAEDLARIMTLESGKPLAESRGEVAYGNSFVDWFAGEAVRQQGAGGGFQMPTPFSNPSTTGPRGKVLGVHQAVGVAALITPWNFPLAMITRKVAPALAAGCTAVVKPSELTPLTALALLHLAREAGIPHEALQMIMAFEPHDVGHEMCTNPQVAKVSFTGSTAVGKQLLEWSSSTVKRVSMELGGNAAFVVFDDADLDVAVAAAMASKFRNAGQTCVCADRFLVHESVHDEFVERLVSRVDEHIRVGDGMEEETTMGPLISVEAAQTVFGKVQDAVQQDGAACVYGNDQAPPQQHFYHPIILTNTSTSSAIWKEETFGPVAAIRSFGSEEEAIAVSNDSPVGLASYVCTRDISRVFRFSERLECGIVGVNDGIFSTAAAPFGGVKESGLGREGGSLGLAEYLETKYIFLNV